MGRGAPSCQPQEYEQQVSPSVWSPFMGKSDCKSPWNVASDATVSPRNFRKAGRPGWLRWISTWG
eukprot:5616223-Pyramimonas_sp.AAC.1